MTAKSITTENTKEVLVDDISNKNDNADNTNNEALDPTKLAALKAKLAQKVEMTAKIVEKKTHSIKLGIVGSGQAGCIGGDVNVYTSDGIIKVKDLFDRYINNCLLEDVKTSGAGTCINISDQNLYTVSIDVNTGKPVKAKVTGVWKHGKKKQNTIVAKNGTTLTCSKTHPSLVYRPGSRKKAFFTSLSNSNPISNQDCLIDARLVPLDCFGNTTFVRGIQVTNDIAWLFGLFASDGSIHKNNNSVSFYCDDQNIVNKIQRITAQLPHSSISVKQVPGCQRVSVFGLNFKLFIESAFGWKSVAYGGKGSKTFDVLVPNCISAASAAVRCSFIAGLIDSDGTVARKWCETSIFTVSKDLADQLACLISTIGGRAVTEIIHNRRVNEATGYRVKLFGQINFGMLQDTLLNDVVHNKKNSRLQKHLNRSQKSFANSSVNIDFNNIQDGLRKAGFVNSNDFYVKYGVQTKNWVSNKRKLSIPSFQKLVSNLHQTDDIMYLAEISTKLLEVESLSLDNDSIDFYDLSVEKYENYLAGNNGLLFTHNSRLSEAFYKHGYDVVVINTATQDLKFIDVPETNKLLLEYGLGGAAKELDIGKAAAEAHRDSIAELVSTKLETAQVNLLCLSLGGGSGAGSCETLVDILANTGKPLCVMAALPMNAEDAQTKHNALETLAKLAKFAQTKKIHNLIVVDNAKIESIYSNVSQMDFYKIANKAIVDPVDIFNTLSSMASDVKGLDPMEWGKLLTDGEGLSIYGDMVVKDYIGETALAEAVMNNLNSNLLAAGFDLTQSRYVGVIFAAPKAVWDKIPSLHTNYALAMVNEQCGNPKGVFKGIYTIEDQADEVRIYSWFSGLGLPDSRVVQLKSESKALTENVRAKDANRNLTLNLDTGVHDTVNEVQKIREKVAANRSAFGMLKNNVLDKRKG